MSAWKWARSVLASVSAVAVAAAVLEAADGQSTVSVVVPRGTAITLDGSLGPEEWEDAAAVPMSDAVTLFFKYADGSLWLGIRAPEMGVVNVLVVDKGDVKVLHSSAALGTARYTPEGDGWRLVQDFVWQCRVAGMSNVAIAERSSFFESERWLASSAYMGNPGDLEVQVAWDGQPLQLAVLWLPVSNPRNVTSWPAAVFRDTLPAPIPAIAHFTTSEWATLALEPTPSAASSLRPSLASGGTASSSRREGEVSRMTASYVPAAERWPS